jgi:hypothetical protein
MTIMQFLQIPVTSSEVKYSSLWHVLTLKSTRLIICLGYNIVTCNLGSHPIQRFVAGQQLRNMQQVL